MSFRNLHIDEVIVLEGLNKNKLAKIIHDFSIKHTIIDLQYAVTKSLFGYYHHAILLIQRKN